MTLSPGSRLGPYEIASQIGAGGMGEVYRARDPRIGRDVAIKVLPASWSQDRDRLRRFEQEARAAGALSHPALLTIYDVGQEAGTPYLVSELLEGETLRTRLSGGPLTPGSGTALRRQLQLGQAKVEDLTRPSLAQQRARFFHVLSMVGFRRDRYMVSDETLAVAEAAQKAAQEASDPGLMRMAEFLLGFSHIWRNELDAAEPLLHASLQKSERAGDIVLQSRCLTYLTAPARKRRDDEGVQRLAERSLAVAQVAGMPEYVMVAKANFAWVAWRQQDFDEVLRLGHEAIEIARGLPLMGPNWWAICFPMIDTLLRLDRTAEAIELAGILIQPQQHRLNDALQKSLQLTVRLWAEERQGEACRELHRACALAQEGLFL